MTILELQTLADREFDFAVTDGEGSVRFAGPMPEPYGEGLGYTLLEDGQIHMDRFEVAQWEYAFDRYSAHLLRKWRELHGKRNRTRKLAEKEGELLAMPANLALPTRKPYEYAISTVENPTAYLQPMIQAVADGLTFENGVLYFRGMEASEANLIQYYDKTPKAVADLDTITLRGLYTATLKAIEQKGRTQEAIEAMARDPQFLFHSDTFYVPKLLENMGYAPNPGKDVVQALVDTLISYTNIMGVMEEQAMGRKFKALYPVMQFRGYVERTNRITFSSPYLNLLVLRVLQAAIQTDGHDRPKLKSNGQPFMLPSHTYLVKSSIMKERNKRAVEIVCAIVTLIEQAGDNVPNIKFQTLIDRCPSLKNTLEAASPPNRNIILRRTFTKVWELLRTQTHLTEVYQDIQLPTAIPTMSRLGEVLRFEHGGKTTAKVN